MYVCICVYVSLCVSVFDLFLWPRCEEVNIKDFSVNSNRDFPDLMTFVLKIHQRKYRFGFGKSSVVKYQLCQPTQAPRFDRLCLEKKLLHAKILLIF